MQELSARLQAQAQQADGFMEELGLMASVTSPESLQDLAARCVMLQESVGEARRLVAAKCEQAEEDMGRLERYGHSQARPREEPLWFGGKGIFKAEPTRCASLWVYYFSSCHRSQWVLFTWTLSGCCLDFMVLSYISYSLFSFIAFSEG